MGRLACPGAAAGELFFRGAKRIGGPVRDSLMTKARKGLPARRSLWKIQLGHTTDSGVSVYSMPHGVSLFNALVAPAAAFGSAVLVSVRTQYRAALGGRFGERLLLWCRETWNDEANFIFEMVALVLIPAAFMLVLLLLH